MVSKAKDDFPEPDKPVITTSLFLGISTSIFLRLCTRAPKTSILSSILFFELQNYSIFMGKESEVGS
jgi:hypothetical protein